MIFNSSFFRVAHHSPRLACAALLLMCLGCHTNQNPASTSKSQPAPIASVKDSFIVLPNATNATQLRLYTNASPESPHLFNTFDIELNGEKVLESPGGAQLKKLFESGSIDSSPHNILVNGEGPLVGATNGMIFVEQSSGPEWVCVVLDGTPAYSDRLEKYTREIVYVEPDLFVVYDHLIARDPADFKMLLHPPAATRVDSLWGDLKLETHSASMIINAAATRKVQRSWEKISSATDRVFTNTVTMQLGPTNRVSSLDVITVFAVHPADQKFELVTKLLESPTTVGARIHRNGLPTLIAFRTAPASEKASLSMFEFSGPVGVSVFKPKAKKP